MTARITDQVLKKPSKNANTPYAIQKKPAINICSVTIREKGTCKLSIVARDLAFPRFCWC